MNTFETICAQEGSILEKKEAAREVVRSALAWVEKKYGAGNGDGENPKFYHNLEHTKNVVEAARKIAECALENGHIADIDVALSEMAAAGHDLEQDLGSGENERESFRVIREAMQNTGVFSNSDIEKVGIMIASTVVSFEGGKMKQAVTEEYLTKILADADLCALGQSSEKYWATAQALLKEIKGTDSPTIEDKLAWARGQIPFLSNHQFHTSEARTLFPHKEENITYAKEQVARLEKEIEVVR